MPWALLQVALPHYRHTYGLTQHRDILYRPQTLSRATVEMFLKHSIYQHCTHVYFVDERPQKLHDRFYVPPARYIASYQNLL